MASKAHVFGSGHLRHLAGVSPTTPPSCAAQPLGTACRRHARVVPPSPCAALMVDLAWLLLLWSGLMGYPSSPRSAAIWGVFCCVVPAAHAGRPDATTRPKRFSVSAAARALGWL